MNTIELKRELNVTALTLRNPFLRNMTRERIVASRHFDQRRHFQKSKEW